MLKPIDKLEGLRARLERKIWKDLATGCWNWTAGIDGRGYPRIRYGKEILYAHHAAVLIYRKVPLDAHVRLLRTCGNRKCVNPDHINVESA